MDLLPWVSKWACRGKTAMSIRLGEIERFRRSGQRSARGREGGETQVELFRREVEEILERGRSQVGLSGGSLKRNALPDRLAALEVRVANIEQAVHAIVVEMGRSKSPQVRRSLGKHKRT
jgi:hypothetical protein